MPATVTVAGQHHETARRNHAGGARLLEGEWERPFREGSSRLVGRGIYTSGKRKHQECVIKWLKSGHVNHREHFEGDMAAVNRALDIILRFNDAGVIAQHVRLNIPEVWVLGDSAEAYAGARVLIEPYIEDFRKWNSNSGWANSASSWGRAMAALSHFSYHITGGQELLCDLQGGFYRSVAVVTDPVICSRDEDYGPSDLGKRGMRNFFAHHTCSEFCREGWLRPSRPARLIRPVQSTTMRVARTEFGSY